MHVHIHNEPNGVDWPISAAEWAAAGISGHRLTISDTKEGLWAQAASLEVLIGSRRALEHLDLFAVPNLRMVQLTSAGVDNLRPFDRIPPNVILANNRGTHARKAGEYALMAILMLVNRIPGFVSDQREGIWRPEGCGVARDKRLTIVGLGSLGGAAAAQARHLGMRITGIRNSAVAHPDCDRTLPMAALDDVLPETEILLLACPLTPATENLLSAARIRQLPRGARVINIGRGRLVDEDALLDALDAGALGGAVLDVFHTEPLPAGHRAWGARNLIITPHMSSDDPRTYNADTLRIFRINLEALLAGQMPPTAVDRVKAY